MPQIFRFASFDLDPRTGELRKKGLQIKLTDQPLQILVMLLERRGDMVSREEFQEKLWPDVNVDEERGLNSAITRLRDALGDSAENPRFVQTIPRRGYRFLVPVELVETGSPAPVLSPAPVPVPPLVVDDPQWNTEPAATGQAAPLPPLWDVTEKQQRQSRRLRQWQWGGVAAVLLAAIGYFAGYRLLPRTPPGQRTMLAVLPFDNLSGNGNDDYFSDGMTEEMISQLGLVNPGQLGVIARTSTMRYKKSGKGLDQVAKDLHVQYVVEGSVRRSGDNVRITAKLIRTSDQTTLWSENYEQPLIDVLKVQDAVAQAVAGQINIQLAPRKQPRLVNAEAYEAALKGRHHWNRRTEDDLKKSVDYLKLSVQKDPNYALAHAWLADAYNQEGYYSIRPPLDAFPAARAEAEKAVALDDGLAEAHTSLADVASYQWKWAEAEKEYRRAITQNPNYATAHQWYATFLSTQARFDEAEKESEKALSLEPVSAVIRTDMGLQAYSARRYDLAVQRFGQALELDPSYPQAHVWLAMTLLQQKQYPQAIDEFQKGLQFSGGNPIYLALLGSGYGHAGRRAEAQAVLQKLQTISRQRHVTPESFSLLYVGLGDYNQVFAYADKAYQEHSGMINRIKVDPILDPVRSDPRFTQLLTKVGFQ